MDLKFTLHYFAKEKEWRLYREDGMYVAFTDLSRVHSAVTNMMKGWAAELKIMAEYNDH